MFFNGDYTWNILLNFKSYFSKNQTNTEGAVVMPSVVLSSSKVEKDSPQEVNNWAAAMHLEPK